MSDVTKINGELIDFSRRLVLAVDEYDAASKDAANKRTDREVEWAQQLLKATGDTVGEREANTVLVCKDSIREARIAEAVRDALKERIRSLQAVLNATQTRASFLKEEMRLTGRDY
jgi:predicted ArsR family transcriptional regulator